MSTKSVLIIAGVVVLLVIGGFFGYNQLNSSDEDTSSSSSSESSVVNQTSEPTDDIDSRDEPVVGSIDGQDLSYQIPNSVESKSSSDLYKRNVNPSSCDYYGESDQLVVVFYQSGSECVDESGFSGSETVEFAGFELTRQGRDTSQGDMLYFQTYQASDEVISGFLYKDIFESDVEADMVSVLESITQE
jgi:hypothetical protein